MPAIVGADNLPHDALAHLFRDDRCRRIGSHAAGIRAGVPFADALVVLGARKGLRPFAVAEREERHLFAVEKFLNDDGSAGGAETAAKHRSDGVLRLLQLHGDNDAFARSQAIGFDDDRRALGANKGERRLHSIESAIGGRRYSEFSAKVLREPFGPLELRRRRGWGQSNKFRRRKDRPQARPPGEPPGQPRPGRSRAIGTDAPRRRDRRCQPRQTRATVAAARIARGDEQSRQRARFRESQRRARVLSRRRPRSKHSCLSHGARAVASFKGLLPASLGEDWRSINRSASRTTCVSPRKQRTSMRLQTRGVARTLALSALMTPESGTRRGSRRGGDRSRSRGDEIRVFPRFVCWIYFVAAVGAYPLGPNRASPIFSSENRQHSNC